MEGCRKAGETVEIIIKGEPKEIAALVVAIHERQEDGVSAAEFGEALQREFDARGCFDIKLCAT